MKKNIKIKKYMHKNKRNHAKPRQALAKTTPKWSAPPNHAKFGKVQGKLI
jgi:hypothetical protein